MGKWFALLLQIFDFFVKAATSFAMTPEGQKEWSDVETAFEVLTNNEDNEGSTTFSVSDAPVAPGRASAAAAAASGENSPRVFRGGGKPSA